jgi:hypothetical protein
LHGKLCRGGEASVWGFANPLKSLDLDYFQGCTKLALSFPPFLMAEFSMISGSSNIAASLGASALMRLDRLMAPKEAGPSADGMSAVPTKSAKDEFLDYQKMTPAEKMRAAMLAKLGVTEEQLKAMSAEDRQKIEDKMKDMIKEQVMNDDKNKDKKGVLVDVKA